MYRSVSTKGTGILNLRRLWEPRFIAASSIASTWAEFEQILLACEPPQQLLRRRGLWWSFFSLDDAAKTWEQGESQRDTSWGDGSSCERTLEYLCVSMVCTLHRFWTRTRSPCRWDSSRYSSTSRYSSKYIRANGGPCMYLRKKTELRAEHAVIISTVDF